MPAKVAVRYPARRGPSSYISKWKPYKPFRPAYDLPPRAYDDRFIWEEAVGRYGPASAGRPLCIGRKRPSGLPEVQEMSSSDERKIRLDRPHAVATGNEAGKGASDARDKMLEAFE